MPDLTRLLALLTVMVAAFGIVVPLVPVAIGAVLPPVRSFEVTEALKQADGRLRLSAVLDKRWCVFQGLSFAYRGKTREVWRVGYTLGDQPANADKNRPEGIQTLGPWIIAKPPSAEADRLIITVRHRCGLVDVVTSLATVNILKL